MQALSRQSEPQQLVWSGWKEIIGGLISPIKGRNCWQSRRCRASFFWCIKSGCSLPRISSLSTVGTLKLSAFLSLRTPSPSLSLSLTLLLSFSHSLSCWRWWKTGMHTGIIIHLKLLNMSWFGLSGTIMGTYKLKACWVEIPWIDAQKNPRQCWKYENLVW